jgi:hypothetical protein
MVNRPCQRLTQRTAPSGARALTLYTLHNHRAQTNFAYARMQSNGARGGPPPPPPTVRAPNKYLEARARA